MNKQIIVTIAVMACVPFFFAQNTFAMDEKFEISRFISPDTCGDCHTKIFSQWQNSMHSLSQKDPIYLAVSEYLLKGLTDKDEIKEGESCVKCHVPVGVVTGYPEKTSDDRKKIPPLAQRGIQCDYCHSVTGTKKMYNNGLTLSPGNGEDDPGIKRGPYKDSSSDFHETMYSEFHTNSQICGTCHNVKHVVYNTNLETTYDEWENGPYNSSDAKTQVTCQECHMYQRPGIPATGSTKRPENKDYASDDGPLRDHVFTHYFVGANKTVPGLFGGADKVTMAEERLKNSATLEIDGTLFSKGKIQLKITNSGAGHKLPTGLTDVRQMWLEVIVKNEKNKVVYSSGILDKDGYISEGTIIYNTVFGDGKGKPVLNISKAKEILKDKRIKPLETACEVISLPKDCGKNISVNVRLLYRTAPQKVIDLVLGKGKMTVPITTMVETKKQLKL